MMQASIGDNERTMSAVPWNHNIHYHPLILNAIPSGCGRALDVGCGQGLLANRLAERSQEVIAIDADHKVISSAMANNNGPGGMQFIEGDVMTYPFPENHFAMITAVATLHHLPLRPALLRFRTLLRPGGILAVVGLYRGETFGDFALAAAAFPTSWMLRCFRGFSDVGAPVEDPQQTMSDLRSACQSLLPGASLKRLLLFRYFLLWRKPQADN